MANTYELCAQMTANGFIPSNHANYSLTNPAQLIKELNGVMTQNFERPVINARDGYWLKSTLVTTIAGHARYRVPDRAAMGGFDRVEMALSPTSEFLPLDSEPGADSSQWERSPGSIGQPRRYELRGNQIHLLPAPDSANYVLRLWYYARPSQLVRPQSPTFTEIASVDAGVMDRGRITSIAGIASRQVVVNAIPFRQRQASPAAIVTAVDKIDIVHVGGWHELALVDATQTFTGTTITIGGSDPLDDIEVGDYVRAADETDWPCIPADFHRLHADLASMTVMVQLHLIEKAAAFGEKSGGDMDRFRDLLQPRVKDQARSIGFPDHVLQNARGRRR
jgi:hypothetical protein